MVVVECSTVMDMVNFLNLRYFVRVAEEKNITRVAEQEHISQQSLSNHIK